MANNKTLIGDRFCFSFKSGSIGTKIESRKYFDEHKSDIDNWWVQTSKIPIFIDTNFLLNAYSLPKTQRTLFVNFLRANCKRIYITDQIDEEYQRKRPNFVKNYLNSLETIFKELITFKKAANITSYCDDLVVKFDNLRKKPIVKNDYSSFLPDIDKTIDRIKEWKLATEAPSYALFKDIESLLGALSNTVESEQKNYFEDSDIVEAVSQCQFCGNITREEKGFIYTLYQECVDERREMSLRPDHIDIQMYTFPGHGDISKEKDHKQREGDFLHYHEMLQQIGVLQKDVIFLTSDVVKGDTATSLLEPFDHYICNCYHLTGHVYYLIDAKTLPLTSAQPSVLDVDIDSDSDSDVYDEDELQKEETPQEVMTPEIQINRDAKRVKFFKTLTKEIFIDELNTCINWSNEYGDKYVGKDFFIFNILGHKRFKYSDSIEMLEQLIEEGVVNINLNEEEKECLVLVKKEG